MNSAFCTYRKHLILQVLTFSFVLKFRNFREKRFTEYVYQSTVRETLLKRFHWFLKCIQKMIKFFLPIVRSKFTSTSIFSPYSLGVVLRQVHFVDQSISMSGWFHWSVHFILNGHSSLRLILRMFATLFFRSVFSLFISVKALHGVKEISVQWYSNQKVSTNCFHKALKLKQRTRLLRSLLCNFEYLHLSFITRLIF